MSKIAVIYAGKYGTTEKYANWIAEETGAAVFDVNKCKAADLTAYDTLVFGGAIHAGRILSIDFLKKNLHVLSEKKIFAYAVGLNVEDEAIRKECVELNFFKQPSAFTKIFGGGKRSLSATEERMAQIPCYFFKGAYDPTRISGMDKQMMGMVKKMISGKRESEMTQSEKDLLNAIENGADYSSRDQIAELVEAVKEK